MFKHIVTIGLSIVCAFSLFGCSDTPIERYSAQEAIEQMDAANAIVIKKSLYSFGDHWDIYADGQYVADINGEFIKLIGLDAYVMRSTNNEIIGIEEEQISFFLHNAKRFNANGENIGYYKENLDLFFFNMLYINSEDNIVCSLKQDFDIALKCNIKDNNNTVIYQSSKDLISLGDRITIKKINDSDVSSVDAVFLTVIANEILESESSDE